MSHTILSNSVKVLGRGEKKICDLGVGCASVDAGAQERADHSHLDHVPSDIGGG